MPPQRTNRSFQVHRVPQHDGRCHQVQAAGTMALLFETAVADFTQAIEEHGAGQRVSSLALVETGVDPSTQFHALEPVKDEERALDATEFPQRHGQAVLTRVAAQLAQYQGGGHRALLDGGRQPQDFVPCVRITLRLRGELSTNAASAGYNVCRQPDYVHEVKDQAAGDLTRRIKRRGRRSGEQCPARRQEQVARDLGVESLQRGAQQRKSSMPTQEPVLLLASTRRNWSASQALPGRVERGPWRCRGPSRALAIDSRSSRAEAGVVRSRSASSGVSRRHHRAFGVSYAAAVALAWGKKPSGHAPETTRARGAKIKARFETASRRTYGSPRMSVGVLRRAAETAGGSGWLCGGAFVRRTRQIVGAGPRTTDSRAPSQSTWVICGNRPPGAAGVATRHHPQLLLGLLYAAGVLDAVKPHRSSAKRRTTPAHVERWSRRLERAARESGRLGCSTTRTAAFQYSKRCLPPPADAIHLLASMSRAGNCYDNARMEPCGPASGYAQKRTHSGSGLRRSRRSEKRNPGKHQRAKKYQQDPDQRQPMHGSVDLREHDQVDRRRFGAGMRVRMQRHRNQCSHVTGH